MLRLTDRVYLNADKTKVVPHGHPDAAVLLGVRGSLISEADAKRLGVKTEELDDDKELRKSGVAVRDVGPMRAQLAAVPVDPDDDSLYDDQTERGVEARKLAREMQRAPIAEYVKSTGGSDEEADRAASEASGEASPQGPSKAEQDKANKAQRS